MAPSTVSGFTCFIAAKDAMQHLERHLPEIEKIFTKFRIQKYDYHLFAGFDEDILRDYHYLEQIHIAIRFKPRFIACLLKHLRPILLPFSAIIFTDKSVHHLPSTSTSTCYPLIDMITTHTISSSSSLSKYVEDGALNVGSSGKNTSDGDKEDEPTEIDKRWNSRIALNIVSDLHDPSQPGGIQSLQLQGEIVIKRKPESDQFQDFATSDIEFTELRTTPHFSPGNLAYSHFLLRVSVDSNDEIVVIHDSRPIRTQKYNEDSPPPKRESSSALVVIGKIIHWLRFGAGTTRTDGQAEAKVSRIRETGMHGIADWGFHINDPLGSGIALSPNKLPYTEFEFIGKIDIPEPPPTHVDFKILSYWSLQGNLLRNLDSTCGKPAYSTICQVVKLQVPSNLRGSLVYDATLELWPKQSLSADLTNNDAEI